MNIKIVSILLALAAPQIHAQNWTQTDEELLQKLSQQVGVKVKSLDFFRTAPPEVAWAAFADLNAWTHYGNVKLAQQAGREIAENPEIEDYVSKRITALAHDFHNEGERKRFLIPLGDVPSPWSLRLLGHYLIDPAPMDRENAPDDYDASPNNVLAVIALSRMNFSDAPSRGRDPQIYPETLKQWPIWWKANEARIEQRIREINPGYYPPTPTATPNTPSPTPTPVVIGEYAATPVASLSPKMSQPSLSATPAEPAKSSDWLIYVIGGFIALCALGMVAWFGGKRS
jgi:hypothetical protein